MWLFLGIVALFVLRFAVHAVSHVLDLVSPVVVVSVVGLVAWRAVVGRRRDRPRE